MLSTLDYVMISARSRLDDEVSRGVWGVDGDDQVPCAS